MFTVEDGRIMYDGTVVGSAASLICAPGELKTLKEKHGVYHTTIPHNLDNLFTVGDRVAGVESKKPADLVASHSSGRLSRQLSTLLDTVDIPILLRRGFDPASVDALIKKEARYSKGWKGNKLWEDLIRYQCLGIFIIDAADSDRAVKKSLGFAKSALGASPVRAVSRREAVPKERKPGWLLRRIPGIGVKTSSTLHEQYITTMGTFSAALSTNEWASSEKIRKAIEEALQ